MHAATLGMSVIDQDRRFYTFIFGQSCEYARHIGSIIGIITV